nr:MAG: aspartate carbamoyltransferase regulatory chain, allosteric domain [Bacteriophage sp.]
MIMNIDSIQNGIVLDHITAGKALQIYNDLYLDKLDCSVAIIKNVKSEKMGRKDILKIDQDIDINLDVLGYIDPDISVNIIKDGKLVEKRKIELPERLVGIKKCTNPRCITTTEQGITHIFKLTDREKRIYRCIYCEAGEKSRVNAKKIK